jgi:hypothetical protein
LADHARTHLRHSAQEISPRFLFISISREYMPSCLTPAAASRFTLRRSEWGLVRSTGMLLAAAREVHRKEGRNLFEGLSFNRGIVCVGMIHLNQIVTTPFQEMGNSPRPSLTPGEHFNPGNIHSRNVTKRFLLNPYNLIPQLTFKTRRFPVPAPRLRRIIHKLATLLALACSSTASVSQHRVRKKHLGIRSTPVTLYRVGGLSVAWHLMAAQEMKHTVNFLVCRQQDHR